MNKGSIYQTKLVTLCYDLIGLEKDGLTMKPVILPDAYYNFVKKEDDLVKICDTNTLNTYYVTESMFEDLFIDPIETMGGDLI